MFTWHLCTCICRAGRWGGGRDKASDKVGLWRLLALLLHHPTANLRALSNTLSLRLTRLLEMNARLWVSISPVPLSHRPTFLFLPAGQVCAARLSLFLFSAVFVTAGDTAGIICLFVLFSPIFTCTYIVCASFPSLCSNAFVIQISFSDVVDF